MAGLGINSDTDRAMLVPLGGQTKPWIWGLGQI